MLTGNTTESGRWRHLTGRVIPDGKEKAEHKNRILNDKKK